MNIDRGNIFDSLPEDISEEIFTVLAQGEAVKIERIISRGQSSPASGWYDQNDNEWVIVLSGEARISLENDRGFHLKAGGYLNIPAHTKHKVEWTKPNTETIWLAVHYK
jgi:cupin 2 domain-containing protein